MTPAPPPAEAAPAPAVRRVAFVVGTTTGGTGTHVAMLAEGCVARGLTAHVLGPAGAFTRLGFASAPGLVFAPVEFGDRPRPADAIAVLRLWRALRSAGPVDVVHAHGLRAGALATLALRVPGGARGPGLVVTVHNAPPVGGGVAAVIYRLLEHLVARGADLVLCVSADLEERMRAAGARHVAHAVVPARLAPARAGAPSPADVSPPFAPDASARTATGSAGVPAAGRPMVLAAGRLTAQKGFDTLLAAAATWRDMDPAPLLVIAGDGPLSGGLQATAAALGVAARFAGQRGDIAALLAAADVFVLPSRWEGQPLVLQEALRAGAPIVATRAGGIPFLTGDDAALLVPPDDPARLAAAVRSVLANPGLAARLRAAARRRAAELPTPDDAVDAALASYAQTLR